MKNLQQIFTAILTASVFLLSCDSQNGDQTKANHQALTSQDGQSNENCTNCTNQNYCGISLTELKQGIKLYRNNVWEKTSTFNDPTNKYTDMDSKLDGRYMDFNIDELENYICKVKAKAKAANKTIDKIRFYYIQYPGEIKTANEVLALGINATPLQKFSGMHSLALVPVLKGSNAEYIMQDNEVNVFSPEYCNDNTAANHNMLCPPMVGCYDGSFLQTVDNE